MNRADENGHLDCVAVSMRAELACFRRVALVARSERACQGSRIYSRVVEVQSTGCAIRSAGFTWHVVRALLVWSEGMVSAAGTISTGTGSLTACPIHSACHVR